MVGVATGANNPDLAFQIFKVSTILSFASGFLLAGAVIVYRVPIVNTFTTNADVVEKVLDVVPLMCFMFLFDSLQILCAGTVRGLGQQNRVAKQVMTAYWVVGLPVGLLSTFYLGYGLKGLWMGLTSAVIVQMVAYLQVLLTTDW